MDWDAILENIILEMEMGWIVVDWEARANRLVAALREIGRIR